MISFLDYICPYFTYKFSQPKVSSQGKIFNTSTVTFPFHSLFLEVILFISTQLPSGVVLVCLVAVFLKVDGNINRRKGTTDILHSKPFSLIRPKWNQIMRTEL